MDLGEREVRYPRRPYNSVYKDPIAQTMELVSIIFEAGMCEGDWDKCPESAFASDIMQSQWIHVSPTLKVRLQIVSTRASLK